MTGAKIIKSIHKFERLTSVSHHPGFSVAATLMTKFRFLTELIIRHVLRSRRSLGDLAKLRRMRGSLRNKYALVLANGPSAEQIDEKLIFGLRRDGRLKVFAVNAFLSSQLATRLHPDYLVLSDPHYLNLIRTFVKKEPANSTETDVANKIAEFTGKIFLPRDWNFEGIHGCLKAQLIFFEDLPALGLFRGIDPTRPRAYISLTSLKALALALYMEPKKVLVLGFDNSVFQGLAVDENNRLKSRPSHHPGSSTYWEERDLTSFFPGGTADFFFDLSTIFWFTKKYFTRDTITNLDQDSLTDAWAKGSLTAFVQTVDQDQA